MPVKSAKQYGMMQAAMHGGAIGDGPSVEVAKEFVRKTPPQKRSSFAKILAKKKKK